VRRSGVGAPDGSLVQRVVDAATARPTADVAPLAVSKVSKVSKVRTAAWVQRAAVTATDKGKGKLSVDTGGDMDHNHIASDWPNAVEKTRGRDVGQNTVFTDVGALTDRVGKADLDASTVPSRLKSIRAFKVPDIPLWQIAKASLPAAPTVPDELPQTKKTVTFKTKLVADDANKKSRGNPTPDAAGPVFLVTGVQDVQ
jgi:hypothetical protein